MKTSVRMNVKKKIKVRTKNKKSVKINANASVNNPSKRGTL